VRVGDRDRLGAVFDEDESVRVAHRDGDARQDVPLAFTAKVRWDSAVLSMRPSLGVATRRA
jgi:hypothetical protein